MRSLSFDCPALPLFSLTRPPFSARHYFVTVVEDHEGRGPAQICRLQGRVGPLSNIVPAPVACRIVGGTLPAMDDAVRRQKMIQDRIADGRLPNNKIGRVSATYGTGEACDACSLAVSTEQVLYRLGRLGVQELIFHNACFAIWKVERDRMYPASAVSST